MAWPPPVLPTTRTDTTVMATTHPAEHNTVNLAINDIVARMPWGVMGYVAVTVPERGFAATAIDIATLSRTWTAQANHYYRVTVKAHRLTQKTATGLVILQITDAAGGVTAESVQLVAAGSDVTMSTVAVLVQGTVGALTRKARLRTTAGAVDVEASGTTPCTLLIEDMGILST